MAIDLAEALGTSSKLWMNLQVNELAVRSLVAEELGTEISGKFSDLLGDKIHQIFLSAA